MSNLIKIPFLLILFGKLNAHFRRSDEDSHCGISSQKFYLSRTDHVYGQGGEDQANKDEDNPTSIRFFFGHLGDYVTKA